MTTSDRRFYAPDGDPWCHFATGFDCVNGERCRNPNHPVPEGTAEPEPGITAEAWEQAA